MTKESQVLFKIRLNNKLQTFTFYFDINDTKVMCAHPNCMHKKVKITSGCLYQNKHSPPNNETLHSFLHCGPLKFNRVCRQKVSVTNSGLPSWQQRTPNPSRAVSISAVWRMVSTGHWGSRTNPSVTKSRPVQRGRTGICPPLCSPGQFLERQVQIEQPEPHKKCVSLGKSEGGYRLELTAPDNKMNK